MLMKRLCLRQNLIESIEGIESLVQLQDLDLYDNRISRIEGLSTLINLESK
jgi:protein phosphatase 1 regulatory subunit 7